MSEKENNNNNIEENANIVNQKTEQNQKKKKTNLKLRTILVLVALILFALGVGIAYRANYVEMKEIGIEYLEVFSKNLSYKLIIGITNFVFIFLTIYITNRLIKKGLRKFFEEEKREIPKLPNKSIALIFAIIAAIITPNVFLEKIIFFLNNAQFGITDPIFNIDIGFYMFQAPLIEQILNYLLALFIGLTVYTVVYYIATFNIYFDGINGQTLKNNTFIKQLFFNVIVIAFIIVGIILLNTQNIVLDNFINLNDSQRTGLVGAGLIESTVKLWGYRLLGIVILVSVFMAIRYYKENSSKNVIKSLAIVPIYMLCLFIIMVGYKAVFINGSELDKEKSYILTNIDYTKTAYNIKIDEVELNSTGTITRQEAETNGDVLNNIPVITKKVVLNNLRQTQTSTGYYTYNDAKQTLFNDTLLYVSPREINSKNTTYNSQADEYTHGYGAILVSASETDENGNLVYLSKDFDNTEIIEPRIYYGMETNSIITVSEKNEEFDYPTTTSQNAKNVYDGNGGITLDLLDRISVSIKEKKPSILFVEGNKILLNRNIITRAKTVMPYLLYDENPYLIIADDGNLYWVIDAYTVSNKYPYSQRTRITYDNKIEEINYIRNSVKVIIDAYNGDINFYITDKTDPIIMVYNNIYNNIFKDQSEIPEGILKYFTYSEFLYNIQAKMLTKYHNIAADVLYRGNDVWQIASYSNLITSTASTQMEPIFTMLKTIDSDESRLGLVLTYNLYGRESMNAYLVGTTDRGVNRLKLYKFSNDNSVIGPIQFDSLIEQDETISNEISALNVTGARITKEMIVVPIDNTILYVIPVYQTSLNEASSVPVLKKVIIASGNKVAIGNNFDEALKNLLSTDYSVNIEVEDTSTIEGLIQMIIKANNNLTESNNSNNWTQIGRDIEELQSLVKQLEILSQNKSKEEDKSDSKQGENIIQDRNIILH